MGKGFPSSGSSKCEGPEAICMSGMRVPFTSLLLSAICKASSDKKKKKRKKIFFAFLFLGDDLDFCLLYNVTNFCP